MLRDEIDPVDLWGWSILSAKASDEERKPRERLLRLLESQASLDDTYLRRLVVDPESARIPDIRRDGAKEGGDRRLHPVTVLVLLNKACNKSRDPADPLCFEQKLGTPPANYLCWQDRRARLLTYGTQASSFAVARAIEALKTRDAFEKAALDVWRNGALVPFLRALQIAAPYRLVPENHARRREILDDWRRWLNELAEQDTIFDGRDGAWRRHRVLALGFLLLVQKIPVQPVEPEADLGALLSAVEAGRAVLASHLVVCSLFESKENVPEKGPLQPSSLVAFAPAQIGSMLDRLETWAREKTSTGEFLRAQKDTAWVEALVRAGRLDEGMVNAAFAEAMGDPQALDRWLEVCFGDASDTKCARWFAALFPPEDPRTIALLRGRLWRSGEAADRLRSLSETALEVTNEPEKRLGEAWHQGVAIS
ncbi:MAG: hypothetical protein NZ555_14475 [Geminicoccaceae bacterium]|nr:hypothetical protein [Geminicoccaceae bacterium]